RKAHFLGETERSGPRNADASPLQNLARIQFDDHRLVDIASDISAVRNLFEGAGQFAGVNFNPLGEALAACQVERFTDTQLAFRLFADGDYIAGLDDQRSDVSGTA